MKKCFFCDCIVIPRNISTTGEVKEFFKKNNIEYTLKYNRSRVTIGNKVICGKCEMELKDFFLQEEDCNCPVCRHET